METLLKHLQQDYPTLTFKGSNRFSWSPKEKVVAYHARHSANEKAVWSLLHEVGHALLDHTTYHTDFELLELEVKAWQKAAELARFYDRVIDKEHIQDCLDTYRDWLYLRSSCPRCSMNGLQIDSGYGCFNCKTRWSVPSSPLCRLRRTQKKSPV